MSTLLLSIDKTAAQSADITLVTGDVVNLVALLLSDFNGPEDRAELLIQWKKADASYQTIGRMNTDLDNRTIKLMDAGVYRVIREAQNANIGVERG